MTINFWLLTTSTDLKQTNIVKIEVNIQQIIHKLNPPYIGEKV